MQQYTPDVYQNAGAPYAEMSLDSDGAYVRTEDVVQERQQITAKVKDLLMQCGQSESRAMELAADLRNSLGELEL